MEPGQAEISPAHRNSGRAETRLFQVSRYFRLTHLFAVNHLGTARPACLTSCELMQFTGETPRATTCRSFACKRGAGICACQLRCLAHISRLFTPRPKRH